MDAHLFDNNAGFAIPISNRSKLDSYKILLCFENFKHIRMNFLLSMDKA